MKTSILEINGHWNARMLNSDFKLVISNNLFEIPGMPDRNFEFTFRGTKCIRRKALLFLFVFKHRCRNMLVNHHHHYHDEKNAWVDVSMMLLTPSYMAFNSRFEFLNWRHLIFCVSRENFFRNKISAKFEFLEII